MDWDSERQRRRDEITHAATFNPGCTPGMISTWHRIVAETREREEAWVAMLRRNDVKAAHPDDGWVERKKHEATLCYPRFDDGVKVGDLLCLGSPPNGAWGGYRVVRALEIGKNMWSEQKVIRFDPAQIELPMEGE